MGAVDGLVITTILMSLVVGLQAVWINKLLNKLMSRDYRDYVLTNQTQINSKKADTIKMQQDPAEFEDLGYLNSMG